MIKCDYSQEHQGRHKGTGVKRKIITKCLSLVFCLDIKWVLISVNPRSVRGRKCGSAVIKSEHQSVAQCCWWTLNLINIYVMCLVMLSSITHLTPEQHQHHSSTTHVNQLAITTFYRKLLLHLTLKLNLKLLTIRDYFRQVFVPPPSMNGISYGKEMCDVGR